MSNFFNILVLLVCNFLKENFLACQILGVHKILRAVEVADQGVASHCYQYSLVGMNVLYNKKSCHASVKEGDVVIVVTALEW